MTFDKIKKHVSQVIVDTTTVEVEGTAVRDEFRVSGLPYCSIKRVTERAPEGRAFASSFYFEVGTAIHELYQWAMPHSKYGGEVFGNWNCTREGCKNHVPNSTDKNGRVHHGAHWRLCTNPGNVCSCGAPVAYVEVELKYRNLSGHIDKMLMTPHGLVIVDYKTCGQKYVEEKRYQGYLPFAKNVEQIETYCALMWRLHRLRVVAYVLVYVGRDRPFTQKWGSDEPPKPNHVPIFVEWTAEKTRKKLEWIKQQSAARRAQVAFDRAGSLPEAKAAAAKMFELRPCQRRTDFHNKMSAAFFREECPLLNLCSKNNEAAVVKKLVKFWKAKR